MTNPFDILPANLFNLFSTQGFISLQRHYMAILLRIYTLAEFNRFGLTREVVLDEIVAVPLCALGWLASAWFTHHHWPAPGDLLVRPGCWVAIACFALFRVFDIAKPWPVKQSQVLPGGLGITVDDLLAAVYVNLVLIPFLP